MEEGEAEASPKYFDKPQFYHNHYIYFTEWLYFYYSFVSYLTSASKAVLHETSSNAVKLDKPNYV